MESLTFESLPAAVTRLSEQIEKIERLILQSNAPEQQADELLTVQQAAKLLNLATPTVYSLISKGKLPYMKQSKRVYFSRTELLEYIRSGRRKTNVEIQNESMDFLNR